jgi:uncharacterized protein
MQLHQDGTLVVAATDLVGFLECDHLTGLEQARIRGEIEKPYRTDPELELLRMKGYEHEQLYRERLDAAGRVVADVPHRDPRTLEELRAAAAETADLMNGGADVIFQATFFDGRWRGHADFLLRTERPSDLGAWAYDIADTKLARHVKTSAILQLCVYADLLERVQGVAPERVVVVTGDGREHPHRLADYAAYYRRAKAQFSARVFGGEPLPQTYPDPVDHCRVCDWWTVCMDRRRDDDHLSLVAGMTRQATERLAADGLRTVQALGDAPLARRVPEVQPRTYTRLHEQARLQLRGRRERGLVHELIPPDPELPGRGLAALPAPSALDVFLDIEADPWAADGGLEYLLGVLTIDTGEPAYRPLWGHDPGGEKGAFEAFIDLVMERLRRNSSMHLYHYGGYESGALKRLMSRHATREDELDELLRGGVLVDLYEVVRHAVRASVESYSIKQVEKFYMPEREGPVTRAGFSVVQYETWLESGEQHLLDELAAYNRDDCLSTFLLRGWLEDRRIEATPLFPDRIVPRPAVQDGAPTEELAAQQAETAGRVWRLRDGVPDDPTARTPEQQARWLLAGLLDWHRRESKPQWWDWFRLRRASMEDLIADRDALGGLAYEGVVREEGRSLIHRYRFEPGQDTKIDVGDDWMAIHPDLGSDNRPPSAGRCIAIDIGSGTIDLRRGKGSHAPHPTALIPGQPYGIEPMRSSLGRIADQVIARGIDGPGPYRAVRELILRAPIRFRGHPSGDPLVRDGEDPVTAARRLALALDETVLPIQGPPGTGKTWTGARMIVELVRAGRRVGVTAQAHRVIGNMLGAVRDAAAEAGVEIRILQKTDDASEAAGGVAVTDSPTTVEDQLRAGTIDVVGGTMWQFARSSMDGLLDVLFVDEAGQLSLASVVSMGGAADSIVLLGDPNQLPQVSQATHPEGAERSALEHVLGSDRTLPPQRGIFLPTTFRMHPEVNAYVSEVFYENRLLPDASTVRQSIGPGPEPAGTGIRFSGVVHAGNAARSAEEADAVARAVDVLIGRDWVDQHGWTRRLTSDDIIIVAPYNAQVAAIDRAVRERTAIDPKVGTVDRFQGQEGAVAIYSMATSSVEDAPRDMTFLYSGNRLNVAVSRARAIAVIVASPALLDATARTPEQMRLVSALCRFAELAEQRR